MPMNHTRFADWVTIWIVHLPDLTDTGEANYRIGPDYVDHNLYIYAWISKQFGTVVALEEEKCHLKTFFVRLKVKVTGVK